jgi:hypothetical protein
VLVKQQYIDNEGRIIIIEVEISDQTYTIVNTYAPVSNYEKQQLTNLEKIKTQLEKMTVEKMVIGGDFNIHLNKKLDCKNKMTIVNDTPRYRKYLISFLHEYNLVDVWRTHNPERIQYTWFRQNQAARLDYFFVSEIMTNNRITFDFNKPFLSDHCLIKMNFGSEVEVPRGEGFWKLNTKLLTETEYIERINEVIKTTITNYNYTENNGLKWEMIKHNIKNESIIYARKRAKQYRKLVDELNRRNSHLFEKIANNTSTEEEVYEYHVNKTELDNIALNKAQGAIIRSRIKWTEEGEKNTSYFLQLEKHNYINKRISNLLVNNKEITDANEILKEEKKFYENLYSANKLERNIFNNSIDNVLKFKICQK